MLERWLWKDPRMAIPQRITCVDCGEPAYLVQDVTDEDRFSPGDIVTYRCSACLDRWDVELTEDDVAPAPVGDDEVPRDQ